MLSFFLRLLPLLLVIHITNGCRRNSQCASGWCEGGRFWRDGICKAKRKDLQPCHNRDSNSCESGICSHGRCGITRCQASSCNTDAHCSPDKWCKGAYAACRGKCQPKKPDGESCYNNDGGKCRSGICKCGTCGNGCSHDYFKLRKGLRCVQSQTFNEFDESKCKKAAKELGLTYGGSYYNNKEVPGCIFDHGSRGKVFFIKKSWRYLAHPKFSRNYAEICKRFKMTIGRKCNRKHNYVGRNRITDNAVCRIAAQELGLVFVYRKLGTRTYSSIKAEESWRYNRRYPNDIPKCTFINDGKSQVKFDITDWSGTSTKYTEICRGWEWNRGYDTSQRPYIRQRVDGVACGTHNDCLNGVCTCGVCGFPGFYCGQYGLESQANFCADIDHTSYRHICNGTKQDCIVKGKKKCSKDAKCYGLMYHAGSWTPHFKGLMMCTSRKMTQLRTMHGWTTYMLKLK